MNGRRRVGIVLAVLIVLGAVGALAYDYITLMCCAPPPRPVPPPVNQAGSKPPAGSLDRSLADQLAACQRPLAPDYPAPWTRLSPQGQAALEALSYGGVGSCVERRHATIANQFLLACSYDHDSWRGLVVATGRREPVAQCQHDDIVALGLPPRELLPAQSDSEWRMEAEMNDMNARQRAQTADR